MIHIERINRAHLLKFAYAIGEIGLLPQKVPITDSAIRKLVNLSFLEAGIEGISWYQIDTNLFLPLPKHMGEHSFSSTYSDMLSMTGSLWNELKDRPPLKENSVIFPGKEAWCMEDLIALERISKHGTNPEAMINECCTIAQNILKRLPDNVGFVYSPNFHEHEWAVEIGITEYSFNRISEIFTVERKEKVPNYFFLRHFYRPLLNGQKKKWYARFTEDCHFFREGRLLRKQFELLKMRTSTVYKTAKINPRSGDAE